MRKNMRKSQKRNLMGQAKKFVRVSPFLYLSVFFIAGILGVGEKAKAEIYFYYDAEDGIVGEELPREDNGPHFCGDLCSAQTYDRGTHQSAINTPNGIKYISYHFNPPTSGSNSTMRDDIKDKSLFPVTYANGDIFYSAYYARFDRVDGVDIWHDQMYEQSADKGFEIIGDGIRWINSRGQWTSGYTPNDDHHYTMWLGNPSYHINEGLEPYPPTESPYSISNPMQFEYERWYSVVFALKIACDTTGYVKLYINGDMYTQYNDIQTSTACSGEIENIEFNGTIAQPRYDAPEHYRNFDALILTDNWQDIIDGGYLQDPEANDTTSPSLSNSQPTGILSAGTTSTPIFLNTDETATCKYSETAGTAYDDIPNTFTTTNSTSHTQTITGLSDGNTYTYYIRCQDTETPPNQNTDDFNISFSVANAASDTSPPIRSNGFPQGEIEAGTTAQDISLTTDEDATCRYSSIQGASYAAMTNFSATTGTNHTTEVTGLENGVTYNYYVKCKDASENTNPDDFVITFSVADAQVVNNSTSSSGGGNCFIATAAYGTPMAEQVKILSRFRDKHLLTNYCGKIFVKLYYKYSQRIADYIRQRVCARSVVRVMLRPLVKITK